MRLITSLFIEYIVLYSLFLTLHRQILVLITEIDHQLFHCTFIRIHCLGALVTKHWTQLVLLFSLMFLGDNLFWKLWSVVRLEIDGIEAALHIKFLDYLMVFLAMNNGIESLLIFFVLILIVIKHQYDNTLDYLRYQLIATILICNFMHISFGSLVLHIRIQKLINLCLLFKSCLAKPLSKCGIETHCDLFEFGEVTFHVRLMMVLNFRWK